MFRGKTCCDVTQTHPALLSIRKLASTGEASQECLHLWEMLERSICDPRVGVQAGPLFYAPLSVTKYTKLSPMRTSPWMLRHRFVGASFCLQIFQMSYSAMVYQNSPNKKLALDVMICSLDHTGCVSMKMLLAPLIELNVLAFCGGNNFVCGRASQWISNGTELCRVAGFYVKSLSDDPEEVSCYGGKSSVDFIADSWRASQSKVQEKTESSGFVEDFKQWVEDMTFKERISWAVGGMVLTAGLLFTSQRKSHRQRQKLAALQRTARRLGGNVNPRSPTN